MSDQCPFCQLMQQPEQLNIVGETENFYAWLEYPQPRANGHANIVPKEHTESVMEFSPELFQEAMTLLRETMGKAMEGLEADGLSIAMNVKEAGGQMLPHAYIQIFPRFQEDENAGTPVGAIFQHREDLQNEEYFKETQEKMDSVTVDFETEKVEPHPESQNFKEKEKASSKINESTESEEESNELSNQEENSENQEDDSRQAYEKDDEETPANKSYRKRGESVRWT